MKSLLLFGLIACVRANLLQNLPNNDWEDYGSYDALVKIGNVTDLYQPLTKEDLKASKNGARFIEEARRFFRTGFYTMPPLDPYYKSTMPTLVIANGINLRGTAKLSDFNVTGLIKFTNDLLELRLQNGRVDYKISVPQLEINTLADIDLTIGRILPFRTKGLLSIVLRNVVVRGALQTVPVQTRGFRVFQLQAQHTRLHADNLKAKFLQSHTSQHLYESNGLGYRSETLDDILKILKQKIDESLANIVYKQVNRILDGPTVNQILAYLRY